MQTWSARDLSRGLARDPFPKSWSWFWSCCQTIGTQLLRKLSNDRLYKGV